MQTSVTEAARAAAANSIDTMTETSAAKSDVDNVAVFLKFIKKAEETAQAAL